MLKRERQSFILRQVNLHNKVLSSDLSQEMQVSEDTIRRDLNELSDDGKIIKVHGGALSKSFHLSLRSPNVYSLDEKKTIAHKASQLIKDGMFVLTTGGTTIIELAKALPAELSATFITVSLPVAYEYIHHPNIEVIFIGDKISKSAQISIGGEAISKIKQIKADLCFLGTNAIDVHNGITDSDWEVVQVKKAMIETSEKVISLAISEKLNTVQRIKICELNDIDILITELDVKDSILTPYHEAGIDIL
ncbi:MAG TPA: DeoR/GlpR family DNA-binding transcription regulator [Chitinophagaceae bacterium]|nr:DeoR/GlpR family DNA-binding transcription regulator [Chitinophagaceae bacterium]